MFLEYVVFFIDSSDCKQSYFHMREMSPPALSKMFCTFINYLENWNLHMLMYQANKFINDFVFILYV